MIEVLALAKNFELCMEDTYEIEKISLFLATEDATPLQNCKRLKIMPQILIWPLFLAFRPWPILSALWSNGVSKAFTRTRCWRDILLIGEEKVEGSRMIPALPIAAVSTNWRRWILPSPVAGVGVKVTRISLPSGLSFALPTGFLQGFHKEARHLQQFLAFLPPLMGFIWTEFQYLIKTILLPLEKGFIHGREAPFLIY